MPESGGFFVTCDADLYLKYAENRRKRIFLGELTFLSSWTYILYCRYCHVIRYVAPLLSVKTHQSSWPELATKNLQDGILVAGICCYDNIAYDLAAKKFRLG